MPLTQPPTRVGTPSVFTDSAQHHDGLGDFNITAPDFSVEDGVSYRLIRSFAGADFSIGTIAPSQFVGVTNVEVESKWRIDASGEIEVLRTEPITVPGETTT